MPNALTATVLAACTGAWRGNPGLTRMTRRLVQFLVAPILLGLAVALGSGLI